MSWFTKVLLFWLSHRYELQKDGCPNLPRCYYSDCLVGMSYWNMDILIYCMSILLILWFFWSSDSSDFLILLILWFLWFLCFSDSSDFLIPLIPLILLISENQKSENQLYNHSVILNVWFFWLQTIRSQKHSLAAIPAVYYFDLQISGASANQLFYVQHISLYQTYRPSSIMSVQMYQLYRQSG